MNNLFIRQTTETPEVDFNLDGEFFIKGVVIATNPTVFFSNITNWLINHMDEISMQIKLVLNLEYMNTGCKKELIHFLEFLVKKCLVKHQLTIIWLYDLEGDDLKEEGEMIQDTLNFPFIFKIVP